MIIFLLQLIIFMIPASPYKPQGGIYVIRVKGVGNYYGESDNIKRRWAKHRKQLYSNRHHCVKLRRAFAAFGMSAFTFEILEQSEELDRNKQLRLTREALLISSDPLCLNTKGNEATEVTELSLPDRPIYRNRELFLERKPRTQYVNVRVKRGGQLLGIECMSEKFRMGTFITDQHCNLTRKTTR